MLRAGLETLPLFGRFLLNNTTSHTRGICLTTCSYSRCLTGTHPSIDSALRKDDLTPRAGYSKSVEPPSNGEEGKPSPVQWKGKWTAGSKKLHKRTLTEDEKTEDRKLHDVFAGVEADDLFGTMSRTKKPGAHSHDMHSSDQESLHFRGKNTSSKSRKKKWADTFGNLSDKRNSILEQIEESRLSELGTGHERVEDQAGEEGEEEADDRPHIRLSDTNRRHSPQWYGRQIQRLGREGQVDKAVEVLERWMLKEDRVMPDFFVFSNLLAVLGRAGRTKQAYKVFNMMKKMGVTPNAHAYTALFNACSNAPDPAVGLDTAHRLRQGMLDHGLQPNLITSRAMMKAFGVCGDLETTFAIADGLARRRLLDAECVSFLLMACISDKENGFRLALEVWRKMLEYRVKPNLALYNLLVRAVRDCGVGNIQSVTELLPDSAQQSVAPPQHSESLGAGRPSSSPASLQMGSSGMVLHPLEVAEVAGDRQKKQPSGDDPHTHKKAAHANETDASVSEKSSPGDLEGSTQEPVSHRRWWEDEPEEKTHGLMEMVSLDETTVLPLPNILIHNTVFDAAAPITIFREAPGRLALMGGKEGLLRQMGGDGVRPDIRTFDLLLSCLPETCQAEEETLVLMEQHGVKPDIDFLNMVIFRRCKRRQFKEAKEVLPMIVKAQLFPNLRTFQYLAMTCVRQEDGLQLLADMESAGFAPSIETLGTLVFASGTDFAYKRLLLERLDELGLAPNVKLLEHVERSLALTRHRMVQAEKEGGRRGQFLLSPEFQESFRKFNLFYKKWLKEKTFTKTS